MGEGMGRWARLMAYGWVIGGVFFVGGSFTGRWDIPVVFSFVGTLWVVLGLVGFWRAHHPRSPESDRVEGSGTTGPVRRLEDYPFTVSGAFVVIASAPALTVAAFHGDFTTVTVSLVVVPAIALGGVVFWAMWRLRHRTKV